jgi:hypothetical protein
MDEFLAKLAKAGLILSEDGSHVIVPEAIQKAKGLSGNVSTAGWMLGDGTAVADTVKKSKLPNELSFGKVDHKLGELPNPGTVILSPEKIIVDPKRPFGSVFVKEPGVDLTTTIKNTREGTQGTSQGFKDIKSELAEMTDEDIKAASDQAKGITKKVAGIAALPIAQQTPTDMNPLNDLRGIFDKYQEAKKGITDAAASQMDLTKDKSASEGISNVLGMAADPMNLVPGAGGVGLAAADIMSSFGGKSKLKKSMEGR